MYIEVFHNYKSLFKSHMVYDSFPSCVLSFLGALEIRALFPLSCFSDNDSITIVMYYGRDNYIGEYTTDVDTFLTLDETEVQCTVPLLFQHDI